MSAHPTTSEDEAEMYKSLFATERLLNQQLTTTHAQMRRALEELLVWSDTMLVAHEHPFLNGDALRQARSALALPPMEGRE